MTEFALVAPVLLLLTFGIIDFGRALYFYSAGAAAAREAARVGIHASNPLPTNSDVRNAAAVHFPGASVTVPGGCYNGPVPSGRPAAGAAWVFISEPNPPTTVENNPPPNAPGGENTVGSGGPCSAINPAVGNQQLQVTVVYNFVPATPLINNLVADHILFVLQVVSRTAY